jgi:ribosomal protein S18 acetylase RimI-like enzyme
LQEQLQGLFRRQTLTATEIDHIRQLVRCCDQYENLHMRIDWSVLKTRIGQDIRDFLYYEAGELVGYLCVESWDGREVELLGMVHPDYRRRGIFKALLQAVVEDGRLHKVQRLILICEHASLSGQQAMQALRIAYDSSEHEMELGVFKESGRFDDRLSLHKADMRDVEAMAEMQARGFGSDLNSTRQQLLYRMQHPDSTFYIATFGEDETSCEEPVGCLRTVYDEDSIGIYGFAVLPAYQGRGYGRQMLEEVIRLVRVPEEKRRIMLEVDINNTRAKHLYETAGFWLVTTYDYFVLDL